MFAFLATACLPAEIVAKFIDLGALGKRSRLMATVGLALL